MTIFKTLVSNFWKSITVGVAGLLGQNIRSIVAKIWSEHTAEIIEWPNILQIADKPRHLNVSVCLLSNIFEPFATLKNTANNLIVCS